MERALVRALAVRREDRFLTPGEFASALKHPEELTRQGPARAVAVRDPQPSTPAPRVSETSPMATSTSGFLGGPTVLALEREVDGELLEADHAALIEEIRATFGVAGHASSTGRSLIWSARRPKEPVSALDWEEWMKMEGDLPHVFVRVISKHGRTRIRVEQKLGSFAGAVFGGVMGGVGLGGAAALVAITWAALGDPIPGVMLGLFFLLPGSFFLSHYIYKSIAASKRATLESLVDRLGDHCEDLVQ